MRRIDVRPMTVPGAGWPDTKELTPFILNVTADVFREQREILYHAYLLPSDDSLPIVMATPHSDESTAGLVAHQSWSRYIEVELRGLAALMRARAIYIVSETWVSSKIEYSQNRERLPEQDPERRECVMVLVENALVVPPMSMWTAEIERNKGRPKLRPWVNNDYGKILGRYAYLLPREAYGAVAKA
jgi:hypothetical protein